MPTQMRAWYFAINLFLAIRNFKKMQSIASYSLNALVQESGDQAIDDMRILLDTPYQDFETRYVGLKTALSQKKSATGTVEYNFATLNKNAGKWEIIVLGHYDPDTARYGELFSNHLRPFQEGSYEQRILNVKAFRDLIGNDPNLAGLKTMVIAFLATLEGDRSGQIGKKENVVNNSDILKALNTPLAIAMYRVLAKLMDKYADDPKQIQRFFDLTKIRRRIKLNGEIDEGTDVNLSTGEIKVVPIQWTGDPLWDLENNGSGDLAIWLSDINNPTEIPQDVYILAAGDFAEKHASELGDLSKRYLCVANMSQLLTGLLNIAEVVE